MNVVLKRRPVDVLLVVGDIHAVRQIRRALEETDVIDRLHHIGDVHEAQAYLKKNEPYEDAPKPGLIILEASLRRQSDIDLLADIKADPELEDVAVVILAGTASQTRLFENCLYSAEEMSEEPVSLPQLVQLLGSEEGQG